MTDSHTAYTNYEFCPQTKQNHCWHPTMKYTDDTKYTCCHCGLQRLRNNPPREHGPWVVILKKRTNQIPPLLQ